MKNFLILSVLTQAILLNISHAQIPNKPEPIQTQTITILQKDEECGRSNSDSSIATDFVPNTKCAEGLSCTQFSYRDHDGWNAFVCQ